MTAKTIVQVATEWGSIAFWLGSAWLWFRASTTATPKLTGGMHDIGEGTRKFSEAVMAQAKWSKWGAITSALAAILYAAHVGLS